MRYNNKPKNFISIVLLIIIGCTQALAQEAPYFTPKPEFVSGTETPLLNLCGKWQFSPEPSSRFWRTLKSGNADWQEINVPGEWVMQGFEVKPNTMAAYFKEIDIPSSWEGKVILLKCDGVFSYSEVFVNGKSAGTHQGGLTPFQLDLTKVIKPGRKNTIIIGVQSESLADTLASTSQYAAHQLGGITRKLELFALPLTYVKSAWYSSLIDTNNKDAVVVWDILIANNGKIKADDLELRATLNQPGGPSVLMPGSNKLPEVPPGGEIQIQVSIPVKDARLWDPEHPNLYTCQLKLLKSNESIQTFKTKIGIREIEVVGNQVFVNNHPIKLRGVNRHEVHPTKGRSLGMEEWQADAKLFKEANVNYIRTSHYPPAEEFISICDSIGLFVECEAPLCWIGHGANAHWTKNDPHSEKLYPLIRQMILETVAQYRNHPSVIIWSMANESAWGPNWEKALKEINLADPARPVSFHDQAYGGFNNFGSVNCQIANIHYPGPPGPGVAWKFDRPLLFGEYAHLNTYNRQEIVTDPGVRDAWGRGLESMWENMYHSTGCLGGAIWSGIDDVFYLPSGKAVGYGEWGPIDGWRRPKPEYWHLKKIYSPVKIVQRSVRYPGDGRKTLEIAVENRHLFTNLSELEIKWKLGGQTGKGTADILPGSSGILSIDADIIPGEQNELELSFYAPQGYLIDNYLLKIGGAETEIIKREIVKPEMIVYENRVSVTMKEEVWSINAVNGKLESVRRGDDAVIIGGPELMILPLMTGPCNTEHSLFIETLNNVCSNWKGRISATGSEGDVAFVQVEGSYDEADIKLTYWFGRSPDVEIDYELTVKSDIDPRQIGLVFTVPREFEKFTWERVGQWTVYPETHIGRTKGSSTPFPYGKLVPGKFGEKPNNIWEADMHPLGINDFRATRDKLMWGSLENQEGHGITLISDGKGAMRTFVDKDRLKFLAAGFSTAGGDLFFSSHLRDERNPLKAGDIFKSRLSLKVN